MKQLKTLKVNFQNLSRRDRKLVFAVSILIGLTLFYTLIWEPIHLNNKKQMLDQAAQTKIYTWMQQAAEEVKILKSTGATPKQKLSTNTPVSILVEQSAKIAGINKQIGKIESSGKNSAKTILNQSSFDQMLLWIHTLKTKYGVSVSSAKIERADEDGIVNARLTFSRK